MNVLAVTHFNNLTYGENERWRKNKEYEGCVYNCPVYIKDSIPISYKIYVIEMNNETNSITGIGLITNRVITKRYKIYSDNNYNRYTYRGKKRIDSNLLDEVTLKCLEERVFTGKKHLKRSQGIAEVPKDVSDKYLNYIKDLFELVFG
jgi:hypothetical protein